MISFNFVPLTFIKDKIAIDRQLINTSMFKVVLEEFKSLKPLGSLLISTQYGYTASAKKIGRYRLLRITDINDGKVNWNSVPSCECEKPEKYQLKQGDILIARTGNNISYQVQGDVPDNTLFASYLIRLKCNTAVLLPEYLYLFLNSYAFWSQILKKQRGAILQNVNAKLMGELLIPYCSIEKQKEIIFNKNHQLKEAIEIENKKVLNIHNCVFSTKTELNFQLTLLKKLRQQILQDAVQGKLVPQDPNDEPASELLERIKAEKEKLVREQKIKKEKPLPLIAHEEIPFEIPENWVWCRLGVICTKITDGTHHSPPNTESGEFKYITAKNIKDEGIDLSNITYVSREVHKEIYNRCNPEIGDILYIKDGATTGIVTINNLPEEFSMLSSVALLKLPKVIHNKYLMYVMRSPFYYSATRNDMYGVAITRVTLNKINYSILPLPPLNEQHRIVTKVEQLMRLCDELEQSIQQNQKYTQELLQVVLKETLEPN